MPPHLSNTRNNACMFALGESWSQISRVRARLYFGGRGWTLRRDPSTYALNTLPAINPTPTPPPPPPPPPTPTPHHPTPTTPARPPPHPPNHPPTRPPHRQPGPNPKMDFD